MKKLSDKILAFADTKESKDFYEGFVDYFRHYAADNYEYKRTYDKSVSFADKEAAMESRLKEEIQRVSQVKYAENLSPKAYITNPMVQWATFAVVNMLIDAVLPDTLVDSIGMYSEIRNIDDGETATFDVEPRDLFLVTKSGRNQRHQEAYRQYNGQVVVNPVEHDVTVYVSLYRVLAGKESLAKFIMKAIRSIEHEITLDAYAGLTTAVAALPSSGDSQLLVTGYTQEVITELCQKVSAFSGRKAYIAGTRLALADILPNDANYRYDLDSEYVRMGYIPTAFGYDIVEMPQKADWKTDFDLVLDDNQIYILSGEKFIKVVIEGDSMTVMDGAFDNADLSQKATIKKAWGVGFAISGIHAAINKS